MTLGEVGHEGGAVNRILIVEDDPATRQGLDALLREAGYQVKAVGSVPAAMRMLRGNEFDLVIADVRVDGYNGLQLVVANTKRIPAIFVTAFADSTLEAEARRVGAEFVLKPVEPRALLAIVAHKLQGTMSAAVSTSLPH